MPVCSQNPESIVSDFELETPQQKFTLKNFVTGVFRNYLVDNYVCITGEFIPINFGVSQNSVGTRQKLYASWDELLESFDRERTWDYIKWISRGFVNQFTNTSDNVDTNYDLDSICVSGGKLQRLSLKILPKVLDKSATKKRNLRSENS